MSEYDHVVTGSLRLKRNQGSKKRKKHKKERAEEHTEELVPISEQTPETTEEPPVKAVRKTDQSHLTKAQREWERRRDKRTLETVLSKAGKSHKQRIIEFNEYLGTLTEHFDIQKVSWTK